MLGYPFWNVISRSIGERFLQLPKPDFRLIYRLLHPAQMLHHILRDRIWRILIFLLEYIPLLWYNDAMRAERSSEVQGFRIGYVFYGYAV